MSEMANQKDIVLCGAIRDDMARQLIEEIQQKCYTKETELRLFIDSGGGSMAIAAALAHILVSAFPDLTTYNLSSVKSAAMYLYLCGSKRFCYPESIFMMHPAAVECRNQAMDASTLQEYLRGLEMDTESAIRFYQSCTGISESHWRECFRRATLLNAQEALGQGIATGILGKIEPFRPGVRMIYG